MGNKELNLLRSSVMSNHDSDEGKAAFEQASKRLTRMQGYTLSNGMTYKLKHVPLHCSVLNVLSDSIVPLWYVNPALLFLIRVA